MTPPDSDDLTLAVAWLRQGKLVAFPTETVYGLGAAATQPTAVERIFRAKGRPSEHPLIVHLPSAEMLADWAADIPAAAWKLAAAFWPGPMTLILKRGRLANDQVTGGLATVGLRVPSHPIALALLRAFGDGIAAPSANRFGRVSPTSAEHVRAEQFDPQEVFILEGEACAIGLESTIVDLTGTSPAILRPGAITAEQIENVLAENLVSADEDAPRCSGRLESHYAPQAAVQLFARHELSQFREAWHEVTATGKRAVVIAASSDLQQTGLAFAKEQVLTAAENPDLFARELYALLRQADQQGELILVIPPEEVGVGIAIWDRLRKAAAPRS